MTLNPRRVHIQIKNKTRCPLQHSLLSTPSTIYAYDIFLRQRTMSATSTPTDSPVHVEPLHNPAQAAQVIVPQAPLGNATNGPLKPGMGAKALLAKKMAKGRCVLSPFFEHGFHLLTFRCLLATPSLSLLQTTS